MKLRTLLFCLALLPVALISTPSYGGVAVKPANVTVDLSKGRPSGRFVISNTGVTEERYRVRAAHFGYSIDGRLQMLPPDENSLANWVKFNPKEFTLPPNSKRAVRFVVLPRGTISDGEYWGAMELESLNTDTVTSTDKEGRSVKVKIIPSVLVPIFGQAGDVSHHGLLESLTLEHTSNGSMLSVTVTNTGQGRLFVRGKFSIVNEANTEVMSGAMPRGLVLPGLSRRFQSLNEAVLPGGRYRVRVEYGANPLKERKLTDEKSILLP